MRIIGKSVRFALIAAILAAALLSCAAALADDGGTDGNISRTWDEGSGTADDPWQISSADKWNELAAAVLSGEAVPGDWYRLTQDITVTTMIGSSAHPFQGHFDGAGHTLTVDLEGTYAAPFHNVDGATFERLRIEGEIRTGTNYAGGLVGSATGDCAITDCVVGVTITATAGNGHAGFVARSGSGSGSRVSVAGSVFTGRIDAPTAKYCAGFLGSNCDAADYCVYAGAMNAAAESTDFIRDNSYAANCYSMNVDGIAEVRGKRPAAINAGPLTAINFGEQVGSYPTSGITAYATGIMYGGTFYAGPGQSVAMELAATEEYYDLANAGKLPMEYDMLTSAGTLTQSGDGWTLTLPDAYVGEALIYVFGKPDFVLPSALDEVECTAFLETRPRVVVIPPNCIYIREGAFLNCYYLTQIRIPANCHVSGEAIGRNQTIYVYGAAGSDAEEYCRTYNNCVFVPIE